MHPFSDAVVEMFWGVWMSYDQANGSEGVWRKGYFHTSNHESQK